MKRVVMIAFHYPPFSGGSGIQRTLKFSRYLPDYDWQPIILTAHARAYPQIADDQLAEIPSGIQVTRAFAWDSGRHLSVRGVYPRWMALPDRWVSWWFGAVLAGLQLIYKHRPDIIWSTYPIATAHLIGLTLHRLSGIPWIADFRDSMTEENYPRDPLTRSSYRWIERKVVKHGTCLIFTATSTLDMYLTRYPSLCPNHCLVIPNGYDEEDFEGLTIPSANLHSHPMRLLHAGVLYPDDRDPRAFFRALARLKQDGLTDVKNLSVDLRAAGSESYYSGMLKELAIDDLVHLLPALPHRQALQDCADADGLLLFQAASCNHQIPAKVYEYLRLRKPILALTDATGDTAALLRETGGATIVDLADEQAIYLALPQFLRSAGQGRHPMPDQEQVGRYARSNQASELASCLSRLTHQ
ncbi:MAG: glycosyltransferase [Candidatus Entotheonellia bacterium]